MSDITTTLVGSLTRDPELRYTTGGTGICSFGVAVNRRWQKDGEWQEEVSFFNVVVWAQLGENVAASLTKGSRVIVFGRLQQRSWETNEGDKRSVVEVVADAVGPDLRWAQAEVTKNERTTASSGPSNSPDPVYGDEEPF